SVLASHPALSWQPDHLADTILTTDPPQQRRLRRLASQALTGKRFLALEPRIEEHAVALLDAVVPEGEMDVVTDFAEPLTVTVLADLLGISRPEMRARVPHWMRAVQTSFETPSLTAEQERDLQEMRDYFTDVIKSRRLRPEDDLI